MKISYLSSLVSVILGTGFAMAATESEPTPEVVGFKPTYHLTGDQLVEGILQVNETLKIKTEMLEYRDRDMDPEDVTARIYRWVIDGKVIGNEDKLTIPPMALKRNLQLEVVYTSKTGDPKQGNPIRFNNLHKVGTTGGTGPFYELVAMAKPRVSDLKIVLPDVPIPGKELYAIYSYEGYGVPEGKSKFLWGEKGKTSTMANAKSIEVDGKVPPYLISDDDIGRVLEVSVQPKNSEGLSGKTVTVSLESVVVGAPVINDVAVINHDLPYLFPGAALSAVYKYDGKGALEDKSLYRWGHVGENGSMIDASKVIESGKVPVYNVKQGDIGKVIQLSLLPANEKGVTGKLVQTSLERAIPDPEPNYLSIELPNPPSGNVKENGDGKIREEDIIYYPVVNDKLTVKIYHDAGDDLVNDHNWYNYQWMVNGQKVHGENDRTYTVRSSDQNKIISVMVSPKKR
ncbi:hypothetical protein [Aeromonas jandaei]|uniref:hypothetical protein n=1 Tax=Aeromonas jandaei TaxID=650 RepID=UPI003B9F78BA